MSMKPIPFAAVLITSLLWAPVGLAGSEWETVSTGEITVKTRDKQGTSVKEIWAEGELAAPVREIQETLMDPEKFPKFMPYVKETRFIGKPRGDGARIVYTRLELPMVKSRDYVTLVTMDVGVAADGSGEFKQRWVAAPDEIPSRSNSIRLRINEGSWHVTAKAGGKSHVVYKFAVDPGGWVPGFAADMGNKQGMAGTFKAAEGAHPR